MSAQKTLLEMPVGGRNASGDFERDLDALGVRRLGSDEVKAARGRLQGFPFVSDEMELGRLRARVESLTDVAMKSDCLKAIAQLAGNNFWLEHKRASADCTD